MIPSHRAVFTPWRGQRFKFSFWGSATDRQDVLKSEIRTLLVVDDDEDHRTFLKRAFKKLDVEYEVQALSSGDEAVAYLCGHGKFKDRDQYPFPGYIISDLNMRDGDGLSILEFLKRNPALSVIPIVIFSSSDDQDDIRHAYLLGASSYFLKPSSQPALENLVERIHGYWKDGLVPQVDIEGFAIETSSKGKAGERFTKPKRRTKEPS